MADEPVCDRCGEPKSRHNDVQFFCPFYSTFRAARSGDAPSADAGSDPLREALKALLANPHGCPMCDSGVLRKSALEAGKDHWPECPYVRARTALGGSPAGSGEPPKERSPHWPYDTKSEQPHRGCGGVVRYYEINSDYGDFRLRCDKCGQEWVEEGPDA